MTFSDFILEKRLEKYNTLPHLSPEELSDLRSKTSSIFDQIGSTYLSKEKLLDPEQHHHSHVHVKEVDHVNTRHFYNEFPRLQSNNDMSYHEEDITMRFIFDYFFGKDNKKK